MISAERAIQALQQVTDAGSGKPVMDLGWIEQVRVADARAVFRLCLPGVAQGQRDRIVQEARELLTGLDGIDDVQIEIGQAPSQGGELRSGRARVELTSSWAPLS